MTAYIIATIYFTVAAWNAYGCTRDVVLPDIKTGVLGREQIWMGFLAIAIVSLFWPVCLFIRLYAKYWLHDDRNDSTQNNNHSKRD